MTVQRKECGIDKSNLAVGITVKRLSSSHPNIYRYNMYTIWIYIDIINVSYRYIHEHTNMYTVIFSMYELSSFFINLAVLYVLIKFCKSIKNEKR